MDSIRMFPFVTPTKRNVLLRCFAVPRTVMRTFRVYVQEDTRSRDLVVVAQMVIRFAALTLFVILVITTVLSANTHAERHRHANS